MIDAGGSEGSADVFTDCTHVADHERFDKGAAVLREVAFDKTANLPPQIFDRAAQWSRISRQQLDFLVAIEKGGQINFPARQIGSVVEAAGIAAVLRNGRSDPKPHAVPVAPITPHGAQADE